MGNHSNTTYLGLAIGVIVAVLLVCLAVYLIIHFSTKANASAGLNATSIHKTNKQKDFHEHQTEETFFGRGTYTDGQIEGRGLFKIDEIDSKTLPKNKHSPTLPNK